MKVIGYLLLTPYVLAMCMLSWISFPLSPSITGLHFSLVAQSNAQLTLLSYGGLGALLVFLGAIAVQQRNRWFIGLVAAALTLVVVSAPLQVAFGDPSLLHRLAREADWQQRAIQFSHQFLPANLGSEATTWSTLPLNTVAERIIAGWYFMGVGWYVTLTAALVLMLVGLKSAGPGLRVQLGLLGGMALLLALVFFLSGPSVAQYAFAEGARNVAQGDLAVAHHHYLQAQHYDGWNNLRIELRERLGIIDVSLGRTGTVDARVFIAEQMIDRGRTIEAIAEYQKLVTSQGEVMAVAQSRLTDLWTDLGLQFYKIGSFGRAVDAWCQALAYDPSNYLAGFCLARGYFAIGRYREAADIASKFLNTSDPVFRANLYCNWADAQIRQGSLAGAHVAYKRAYDLDYAFNRRALQSTVGP